MNTKLMVMRICLFLCGGIVFIFVAQNILRPIRYGAQDYFDETTRQIEGFYDEKNDTIDVVFLGTSHMNSGIIPMELYREYGLKSYNLATSAQPLEASYYLLREVVKTQEPRLCVIDASGLWIEEPPEYAWRYVIDNIRSDYSKVQLADLYYRDSCDCVATQAFPLFYYHGRWKNLEYQDFMEFSRNKHFFTKGNLIVSSQRIMGASVDVDSMNEEERQLEENRQYVFPELEPERIEYLLKIVELCKRHKMEILVTKIPVIYSVTGYSSAWTRRKSDATKNLCANNSIAYYDLLYDSEINLDWTTDTVDGGMHLNYLGGKKVTEYMGEYILDRYGIEGDNGNLWGEDLMLYNEMKDVIELQMDREFKSYIARLQNGESDDKIVLIATADICNTGLDETELKMLFDLGLNTDFMSEQNKAYVAVIKKGKVIYEVSADDVVKFDWDLDDVKCTLSSAGPENGANASIQIGGEEYAVGGRGFNIVVYDCTKNIVLDSKCFDTYEVAHRVLVGNQLRYAMDVENYLIEKGLK